MLIVRFFSNSMSRHGDVGCATLTRPAGIILNLYSFLVTFLQKRGCITPAPRSPPHPHTPSAAAAGRYAHRSRPKLPRQARRAAREPPTAPRQGPRRRNGSRWQTPGRGRQARRRLGAPGAGRRRYVPMRSRDPGDAAAPASGRRAYASRHAAEPPDGHRRRRPAKAAVPGRAAQSPGPAPGGRARRHGETPPRTDHAAGGRSPATDRADGRRR